MSPEVPRRLSQLPWRTEVPLVGLFRPLRHDRRVMAPPTHLVDALKHVQADLDRTDQDRQLLWTLDPQGTWWVELVGVGTFQAGDSWFAGDDERPDPGTLLDVAEAAQEVITERTSQVWPMCSRHRLGLHADLVSGEAVWHCNMGSGHVVAPIGQLTS
jgi:hypothetical protein